MAKPTLALAALMAATLGVSPTWALCALCTAEIRLDAGLAECFLKRSVDEIKAVAAATKGFVIVDLRDCDSRGSLPTGAAADGPPPVLDDRFVADEAGLRCLSAQIEALDDAAMASSHVFDLQKDCPAQ